jgi:hypothetical protein
MPFSSKRDDRHGCVDVTVRVVQGSQRGRPWHRGAPLPILFRLLALLVALAATPTVVFAKQGDNEQGKGDDATGAWLVTDTGAGSDGRPSVLAFFTGWEPHQRTYGAM